MLNNQDVAVLTRLNELAERFGLKPYDFVATIQRDKSKDPEGSGDYVLNFEVPASGNALREERFDKMITSLGIVVDESCKLVGSTDTIIDALDAALQVAPPIRRRF